MFGRSIDRSSYKIVHQGHSAGVIELNVIQRAHLHDVAAWGKSYGYDFILFVVVTVVVVVVVVVGVGGGWKFSCEIKN